MLELSTLGSLQLRDDCGNDLIEAIAQPKRLALLVYLAVASPGGYHRRDSLVALLWPELPQERARAALRKALYYLRATLTPEVLRVRGEEEVGIDPQRLNCDACDLQELVDRGESSRALELYAGEFLPGFHVSDAPGFEQWIDNQRFALNRIAIDCATAQARALAERHGFTAAVASARRAVELAPLEESTNSLLISTLISAGDRSAAVVAYQRFTNQLRAELECEPSEDLTRLVNRVSSSTATTAVGIARPEPKPDVQTDDVRPHRRFVPRSFVFAALAIALLASTPWAVRRITQRDKSESMVVFPVRISGSNASLFPLREATPDLVAAIAGNDSLPRLVDPRITLAAWRRAVEQAGRDLSNDESMALARKLGATRALLIDLIPSSRTVAASARIVRVSDGKVLAEHSEAAATADLELLTRLLSRLIAEAGGESQHRLSGLSDSLRAVVAYLRGMRDYRLGLDESAYQEFSRALDIDSTFAAAALWRSYAARMSIGGDVVAADRKAWSLRDRMNRRDRALLWARFTIGPNYPKPSTDADLIDAAARAAQINPDRAEAWADWGRLMLQGGALAGIGNSRELAAAILDSAIALDSTLSVALDVRLWTAVELGNRGDIRRFHDLYVKLNPHAELIDLEHWMTARALGDSQALALVRSRFPEFPNELVRFMAAHSAVVGAPLADAESVLQVQAARGKLKPEWERTLWPIYAVRGRVNGVVALVDSIVRTNPPPAGVVPTLRATTGLIELALADPGYDSAATTAAHRLEPLANATNDAQARATAKCYSAIWRMATRNDTSTARDAISYIRSVAPTLPFGLFGQIGQLDVCPLLLEAQLEATHGARGSSPALDALEGLMKRGVGFELPGNLANLMIARWRERQGRYPDARAATRRTMHALAGASSFMILRPAFLREEAKLAALIGDTTSAIRAYRSYLTLRDRPEVGAMRAEVRNVEAELSRLEILEQRRASPKR